MNSYCIRIINIFITRGTTFSLSLLIASRALQNGHSEACEVSWKMEILLI